MKIYGASKIWHAALWQAVRKHGFEIVSSWIDIEQENSLSPPMYKGRELTRQELWVMCLEDVRAADVVFIYCGSEAEQHNGAVMEAGHAIALGKPIFCINTCFNYTARETSDAAFTHHPLWHWVNKDGWDSFATGFEKAYSQARWHRQNETRLVEEQYQRTLHQGA